MDYLEKLYAISSKPKIASDCFSILKQKVEKCPTEGDEEQSNSKKIDETKIDENPGAKATNSQDEEPQVNRQLLLKYLGKIWFKHEFDQQTSDNNLV